MVAVLIFVRLHDPHVIVARDDIGTVHVLEAQILRLGPRRAECFAVADEHDFPDLIRAAHVHHDLRVAFDFNLLTHDVTVDAEIENDTGLGGGVVVAVPERIENCLAGQFARQDGGERVLSILRAEFHPRAKRQRVDGHHGGLAADLDLAVDDTDVFSGANLFRLSGELLVVSGTFLRVGHILRKGALGILVRQGSQAVVVLNPEVIETSAVGEAVLRDDDAAFAAADFLERGFDVIPIARFNGGEESLHVVRHFDSVTAGQSVSELTAQTSRLREFAGDDFLLHRRRG